ncbi:Beta lactamase superfamily domain [Trypanosoma vivax]|uniref:Metallo-beta-lactamase domain-containing protein n=1 Tax=Trypanosoma vivax (strain Y486) TaxID=1055687 RepID=G0U0R5_TRYVY|nr:hypothetical protein TRVL_00027 [Trypanosoma vivax]KAH8609226.1 Beta lactamase superfamily domain [Trypanosoma vivax]CCC49664.1 conserved hypothetical protein [Trypanosoma vivax Y486]
MATEMKFLRAVIIGSGSSSSTPMLSCALSSSPCSVCSDALANRDGRNHRLNPSFLIQFLHPVDGTVHNVLIDCGKTFRESALRTFPKFGVRDLSAVLLTHDHADASYGLDDLRELQSKGTALPVYTDAQTIQSMRGVYPFLFPNKELLKRNCQSSQTTRTECKRQFIASLDWKVFEPLSLTRVNVRSAHNPGRPAATWCFVPIPVPHNADYFANAFIVPMHGTRETPRLLLYMSDVSDVREEFFYNLARSKELLSVPASTAIEVLVLDMLSRRRHPSHLHVDAAISAARRIGARQTFFVGMGHRLDYESMTHELKERNVGDRMQMGYDGCVVAVGSPVRQHL